MAAFDPVRRGFARVAVALVALIGWPHAAPVQPSLAAVDGTVQSAASPAQVTPPVRRAAKPRPPDFAQMLRQQAGTDRAWRDASAGFMHMEKITYRSRVGDLAIPAFVFQPLQPAAQFPSRFRRLDR